MALLRNAILPALAGRCIYLFLFYFFLNVSPPELERCMGSGTVVVGLGTVKRSYFRFEQHFFKGKQIPKMFKKKEKKVSNHMNDA